MTEALLLLYIGALAILSFLVTLRIERLEQRIRNLESEGSARGYSEMSAAAPCYIGVNTEGYTMAACVDTPDFKKETTKTLADWIKRGLTVARVTVAEARKRLSEGPPPGKQPRAGYSSEEHK